MRSRGSTRFRRAGALVVAMLIAAAAVVVGQTIMAGPAKAAPPYNYGEALQKAIWFYDAQRLGDLPATGGRVSWRGDSFLNDKDGTLDLTGGFADAGDHIKATFPFAHSMTTLAWGMLQNPTAYTGTNQGQFLLSNLRWGMDYLIKAHPAANKLVGEIGDPNLDHQVWASAEVQNYTRQVWYIDSTCGGSDLAASAAAAFAAASMVFRSSDATYATTLLTHARQLYTFADTVRKKYSDCIPVIQSFYNSWSGFNDELVWGAIWMSQATTGTESSDFLAKAESYYANLPKEGGSQGTVPEYKWTFDWDDKTIACEILLAKITGKAQYITDASRWIDFTTDKVNGFQGQKATYSPGGEIFYNTWGSLRYAVGAAWLAFVAADSGRFDAARNTRMHDFAVKQVNYTLGDNPSGVSYMVGFSNNFIKRPHHRTAHGSWKADFYNPVEDRHTLYGGLVGGPKAADDTYGPEDRNDFGKAEVALDYNAAYTASIGRMWTEFGGTPLASFPPTETPDGPEMQVLASVNAFGTNFVEIKALVQNTSAWPARVLNNGSFRYYFTLDPGVTPAQVTVVSNFHQCATPSGITQSSGSTYFVTISCAGTPISPSGDQFFTKENQFRINFPGAHTYQNDWSFQGVNPTAGGTPTSAPRITLFDGTNLVWGTAPGPDTPPTPPGAPGQPTASNITSNSVQLTWTASTAATFPIGGYDVYRVGTPDAVVASTTGAATLTAAVTSLTPSTAYTFYVRARDTIGTPSANSLTRNVTTLPGPTPPGAPGQPTASNITANAVTLTWTAATAGGNPIAGYNVFRVGTPDTQVATTTGTSGAALTATVGSLQPATTYQFYVKARDTTGVLGAASANRSVTTLTGPTSNCRIIYTPTDFNNGGGFGTNFAITNTGTTAINGWTMRFTWPGTQHIADSWSATWTQTGADVTAVNLSWNATIAPNTTINIGFNATYSGSNPRPTTFTLNGVTCSTS